MTGDAERRLLAEYLATCERLATRFEEVCAQAGAHLPTTPNGLAALETADENTLLAFIKRFEQFEDMLQRTIKTVSIIMEHGKFERLTARDVTDRAVNFGIVDDGDRWAEAVRTRNALAHEYPLRPDKRAEQLNRAWTARATLAEAWAGVQRFVAQEKLARSE